jgi:hypothetical protein
MIFVDFPPPGKKSVSLKISGHSGMDEKGKDIVCSAVSVLAQTFAGGIESQLQAKVSGKLESGQCDLVFQVPEEFAGELAKICEIFKFGFHKIAKSYPEHVKLIKSPQGDR